MANDAYIEVYVLLFDSCFNDHIELVLEEKLPELNRYYLIDRWTEPGDGYTRGYIRSYKGFHSLEAYCDQAAKHFSFTIRGDWAALIQDWEEYQQTCGCIITRNCADATLWFAKRFVDVPALSFFQEKISTARMCCFFRLPSFMQPITLPERVYKHIYQYTRDLPVHRTAGYKDVTELAVAKGVPPKPAQLLLDEEEDLSASEYDSLLSNCQL